MSDGAVVPEGIPLDPRHWHHLHVESGISEAAIRARGYRTVTDPRELTATGFSPRQAAQVPGILIPIWAPDGRQVSYGWRPDEPEDPKRKYENLPLASGGGNRLDVPPLSRPNIGDPNTILAITEGWKKGDALSGQGMTTIVLAGVGAWRGTNDDGGKTALADWDDVALNGRRVVIIYDSDVMRKRQVRSQLDRLTGYLRSKGAIVWWVFLPDGPSGEKVGVDDYLVDHTMDELAELMRLAEEVQGEDPFFTLPFTDLGNAERFAWFLGSRAAWCQETKMWYCWDGARWDGRPSLEVERMAKEAVREMQARAESLPATNPTRDVLIDYARGLENGKRLREMIEWAKAELEVRHEVFDRDPWLLNCANGTIDLRTGKLQPHEPLNFITKVTPVAYDPDARNERWDCFIRETTAGKDGLEQFLRMAVGYSATGLTTEEKLFMIVGPTRAGKSTLVEAVKAALGEYAVTSDFETFLAKANAGGGGPSEGIARLAGTRFVSSSEIDEGRKLAIAAVKQLTGGDKIAARFLYKGLFEYTPQFALWLIANVEPLVPQDEQAMWERVYRLPFDNEVPFERRDLSLKSFLTDPTDGAPAVLRWIVDGCLEWQAAGRLTPPQCVIVSTNEYRERMDPLADFIEDLCVTGEGHSIRVADLSAAYTRWARNSNEKIVLGRTAFKRAMEARGFEQRRGANGGAMKWQGIALSGAEEWSARG